MTAQTSKWDSYLNFTEILAVVYLKAGGRRSGVRSAHWTDAEGNCSTPDNQAQRGGVTDGDVSSHRGDGTEDVQRCTVTNRSRQTDGRKEEEGEGWEGRRE